MLIHLYQYLFYFYGKLIFLYKNDYFFILLDFSYQPVDDPLLRSNVSNTGSLIKELFRPSYTHPTVSSARITKYLITFLSKKNYEV